MQEIKGVSVIIPVYNEEKHIGNVIESLSSQTWDGNIEIVIIDGMSTDNTVNIIERLLNNLKDNIKIKVLNNPNGQIPTSLNIGCKNSEYDIIIRLDGHTYAPENYISKTVENLKFVDFKGISGGRCVINPSDSSIMAKAISKVVCHPLGIGNAQYRMETTDEKLLEVDTVPFAAFHKSIFLDLGGYDEELLYDEDYDFNYRGKKKGYKVILDSSIKLNYFSRKNLIELWKQYYRYGFWGNKTCQKHKAIPSVRRCIPAAFVLFWAILALINLKLLVLMLIVYLLPILVVTIKEAVIKEANIKLALAMIPVFPILHFSYGIGIMYSFLTWFIK